jgi:hypothetical protein
MVRAFGSSTGQEHPNPRTPEPPNAVVLLDELHLYAMEDESPQCGHSWRPLFEYTQKRKKKQARGSEAAPPERVEAPPRAISQALKRRWAHFIKQVYEADPLLCPQCGGSMRIIAFIDQAAVIEKILTHLGLWPANAHSPPAGYPLPFSLQRVVAA